MDDNEISERITRLVDEEHALLARHGADGLSDEEHDQLRRVEKRLDQAWDLLRQRRARSRAGLDPDDAEVRGSQTVEGYSQ